MELGQTIEYPFRFLAHAEDYEPREVVAQGSEAAYTPLIVRGAVSATANLQECQNSSSTVLASIDSRGCFTPTYIPDEIATPCTLYYSKTKNKLVFKDATGQVNDLY